MLKFTCCSRKHPTNLWPFTKMSITNYTGRPGVQLSRNRLNTWQSSNLILYLALTKPGPAILMLKIKLYCPIKNVTLSMNFLCPCVFEGKKAPRITAHSSVPVVDLPYGTPQELLLRFFKMSPQLKLLSLRLWVKERQLFQQIRLI